MCKLNITIQKEKSPIAQKLIAAQFDSLRTEKDGICAMIINQQNQMKVWRELDNYDKVYESILPEIENAKLVALHTRTGTSGSKNLYNVHFFEDDNWLMAHNGFVSAYHSYSGLQGGLGFQGYNFNGYKFKSHKKYSGEGGYVEDVEDEIDEKLDDELEKVENCTGCSTSNAGYCKRHKESFTKILELQNKQEEVVSTGVVKDVSCDSRKFLEKIPKPITKFSLDIEVESKDLSGMAFLINKETKESFLVVKKEVIALSDNKTFYSFFSYDPVVSLDDVETKNYSGIPVITKTNKFSLKLKPLKVVHGTHKINL